MLDIDRMILLRSPVAQGKCATSGNDVHHSTRRGLDLM